MSNFFIAFHCEISKNAAQIFVVLQKHFAALQSKKVSKKQSLSVVLLYNLGEYKCLKDKRKRGKQARPFILYIWPESNRHGFYPTRF